MSRISHVPLTILLTGITATTALVLVTSIIHYLITSTYMILPSAVVSAFYFGLLAAIWYTVWLGRFRLAAYLLTGVVWLLATYLVSVWGVQHPSVILIYTLAILVAGILVGARAGIVITAVTILMGIIFILSDDLLEIDGIIGFASIIGLVELVSWLSGWQTRTALAQARASEYELKRQRDGLELMVAERTLELQRYAEFGRLTAGLIHDLANPLTTAALSLQLLNTRQHSRLAKEASRSIAYLESYVAAARRQLQQEAQVRSFAVSAELKQVLEILNHRAKTAHVTISVTTQRLRLYGDPVKFNHLATNLIANAIDAYDGLNLLPDQAVVTVNIDKVGETIILRVADYGSGISGSALSNVFQPFFSTKTADDRGTGLGLAIAKRISEDDFCGSLEVTSSVESGTIFTAYLNRAKTKEVLKR